MRKVDKHVLVTWMYAMLGKVLRIGVVAEVVEGRNDRTGKNFGEGKFAWGIKGRINADGKEGGSKSECSQKDEREWSGNVN